MPSAAPSVRRTFVSASRLQLRHRGFDLEVTRSQDGSDSYAFSIRHDGLTLHASPSEFRTPQSAERAARVFIDDALGGFEYATRALS